MKKIFALFFVMGIIGVAYAGYYGGEEVKIVKWSNGRFHFTGSLETVRASSDNVQFIGCILSAYGKGELKTFCHAMDKKGNYISGSTTNPEFAEVVKAMTRSSKISCTVYNEEIEQLQMINQSQYIE